MDLSTKFNMGQLVVAIHRTHVERPPVKCHACEDGSVVLRGEKYQCPACRGTNKLQASAHGWVIRSTGRVGSIRIEHQRSTWDQEIGGEDVDAGALYTDVKYMLDSTGVGSGSLYEEWCLFPSREKAQEECDKRNDWTVSQ